MSVTASWSGQCVGMGGKYEGKVNLKLVYTPALDAPSFTFIGFARFTRIVRPNNSESFMLSMAWAASWQGMASMLSVCGTQVCFALLDSCCQWHGQHPGIEWQVC